MTVLPYYLHMRQLSNCKGQIPGSAVGHHDSKSLLAYPTGRMHVYKGEWKEGSWHFGLQSNWSLTHKLTSWGLFQDNALSEHDYSFFSLISRLLSALHSLSCAVLTLIYKAVLSRALTHQQESLYHLLKRPLDRRSLKCSVFICFSL